MVKFDSLDYAHLKHMQAAIYLVKQNLL